MALEFTLTTLVSMASDILLGLGAAGAAIYCMVLARRLKRFNNLENGVGGAVAVLSAQVDDMTRTLDKARSAAATSSQTLTALTERAEASSRKLELMMASLHDLPDEPSASEPAQDAEWTAVAEEAATSEETRLPLFTTKRATGSAA